MVQQSVKENELLSLLLQESKEKSEESLYAFFEHFWDILEPRFDLDTNWHIGLICEYLEAVYHGEIEKLNVNIPTRYLKSLICTIAFPAWCWIKNPQSKIISWSYADSLSSSLSWKRRQLIESPMYQGFWGDKVIMSKDQNQKTEYSNTAGGSMFASSTGGTMTGKGCDIMVIDDPVKPEDAANDNLRIKSIDFWKTTASSRFDNKKKKSCVLVMQRLHDMDLAGHFIEEYPETVSLVIPNQCEDRTIYTYPRTNRSKIYEQDEILQPSREGEQELAQAKNELGSFNYSAQRQQNPVPRDGGIFKHKWFNYYDITPDEFDFISISADCTFKDLETSDFVVLQVWGQVGARHYILKQHRSRMGFRATKESIRMLVGQYPTYGELLVEDKANGTAIIEELSQDFHSVLSINPKESKIARAVSCEPMVEAGGVYLPNPKYNPWVQDLFLPEVTRFPKAKNDDQVDAMTQYLNRSKTRQVSSLTDSYEEDSSGATLIGSLDF